MRGGETKNLMFFPRIVLSDSYDHLLTVGKLSNEGYY